MDGGIFALVDAGHPLYQVYILKREFIDVHMTYMYC